MTTTNKKTSKFVATTGTCEVLLRTRKNGKIVVSVRIRPTGKTAYSGAIATFDAAELVTAQNTFSAHETKALSLGWTLKVKPVKRSRSAFDVIPAPNALPAIESKPKASKKPKTGKK